MRADVDDLLRPTLEEQRPRAGDERPWRVGSQVYVAFFGGVLAVTAIAWLNGGRLNMESRRRNLILAVGAVGLAAALVVAAAVDANTSTLRLIERGIALVTYGGLYLVQRTPDRVYHYFTGRRDEDDYESLWGPGLVAVVVGGLAQLALLAAVVG